MRTERKSPKPLRRLFIFLAICTLEITIGSSIPLEYMPRIGANSIQVIVEYQGAFEPDIERILTIPIENALSRIRGVEEITSQSERERCRVQVLFSDSADLKDAYLDVREAVYGLYAEFPESVQRPLILMSDPQDRPVFIAALSIQGKGMEEEVKRRFESVEGVGEVEIGGGEKQDILVQISPDLGIVSKIPFFRVLEILREWNVIGSFHPEGASPKILDHRILSPRDIQKIPLAPGVSLGNIAEVRQTSIEKETICRVDGEELCILYLRQAGNANTLSLSQNLRELSISLPGTRILFDAGEELRNAFQDLLQALLWGVFLVSALTLLFLKKVVLSFLVSLSIPFSIFFTLSVLNLTGHSLNMLSLAGLSVGTGLLIDSGLLYGEAFLFSSSVEEAGNKTKDPILFSSLTTLSVLFPLLFVSRSFTAPIEGLVVSISIEIFASLLYVFFFLPSFLSGFYRSAVSPSRSASHRFSLHQSSPEANKVKPFLARLQGSMKIQLCLGASLAAISIGSIGLLLSLPSGNPATNSNTPLDCILEYESGVTLDRVFATAAPLEEKLKTITGVRQVITKYEQERASFTVSFEEKTGRNLEKVKEAVKQLAREEADAIPEGFLYFPDRAEGGSAIQVILTGNDTIQLRDTARRFAESLRYREILFHFKEVLPTERLKIDLKEAVRLGVEPAQIASLLHWALSAPVADKSILPSEEVDLRLTVPRSRVKDKESLRDFIVPTAKGVSVRIGDFSSWDSEKNSGRIYRVNRSRSAVFSVLTDLKDPSPVIRYIEEAASRFPFPAGYTVQIAEDRRKEEKIRFEGFLVLSLSLVLLVLILIFYYEQFLYPLVILFQILASLFFPLVFLQIGRIPLTVPAALGFLLTAGTVVNNSFLVFKRENSVQQKAPIDCFAEMFRPMLLAVLTNIAGVLPVIASAGTDVFLSVLSLEIAFGTVGSLAVLGVLAILIPGPHARPKSFPASSQVPSFPVQ